jgi:hypothetical protein
MAQKMFIEPLCTRGGVGMTYGNAVAFRDWVNTQMNASPELPVKAEFHASILPRAMETAKLLSSAWVDPAYHDRARHSEARIQRMCHVSEHLNSLYESERGGRFAADSQTTTRLDKSTTHAMFLNLFLSDIGLPIDTTASGIAHCCSEESDLPCDRATRCGNLDGEDYSQFVETELPKLASDNVHIIASHGGYIRAHILGDGKAAFGNVDAILVRYDFGDGPPAQTILGRFRPKPGNARMPSRPEGVGPEIWDKECQIQYTRLDHADTTTIEGYAKQHVATPDYGKSTGGRQCMSECRDCNGESRCRTYPYRDWGAFGASKYWDTCAPRARPGHNP